MKEEEEEEREREIAKEGERGEGGREKGEGEEEGGRERGERGNGRKKGGERGPYSHAHLPLVTAITEKHPVFSVALVANLYQTNGQTQTDTQTASHWPAQLDDSHTSQ